MSEEAPIKTFICSEVQLDVILQAIASSISLKLAHAIACCFD
ncbi:hypothetical protein [Funiculus sociatus]